MKTTHQLTNSIENKPIHLIKSYIFLWVIFSAILFSMAQTVFSKDNNHDYQRNTGKEITTLFRAARKVISDNQVLINDAKKDDKGLSADVVIETTKENYQKETGHPLRLNSNNSSAVIAMIKAIRDTMSDAQPLINEKGKGFKGFLPAVFAGRVANNFSKSMRGSMSIKLTAPMAYVRNRANRPDQWENSIIESKFKSSNYVRGQAFSEMTTYKGKPAYRYILPEYYSESCLDCHGEPKGETDISGGKMEGAGLNELGGAISFILFR